jgi:predicted Zn-dependent peptidase
MSTAEARYFSESLDVTQGKLAVGFRLGEIMKKPDLAALLVFNALYGGSVTSKLFLNVRERLSLCYYASSQIERHKGLMIVSSGIEVEKYDEALAEILRQLDLIRQGEISDDELENSRKSIMTDLRSVMDSQIQLENFYLGQAIDSLTYAPDVLAELVRDITKEDILAVADSIRLDSVYFLKNAEGSR